MVDPSTVASRSNKTLLTVVSVEVFFTLIVKLNTLPAYTVSGSVVNPVTTEEYLEITKIKQAYRPRNSKLSKDKLKENGFEMLPSWQDATDRYCKELIKEK